MYPCPHCQHSGISTLAKLGSAYFAPATCQQCGKQSLIPGAAGHKALILWILLTWVFIGVAMLQQMPIYMIGTIPAFILAIDKCMLAVPLQACS